MPSRLEILVVDSGAIIRGHGLGFHKVAKEDGFYTVEEVIREIRDSKSRELLNSLPFELRVRQPPDFAMRAVANFAKKTGDFSALSLTDLKLLALTYAFEVEISGGEHVRLEPAQPSLVTLSRPTIHNPNPAESSPTPAEGDDFDRCTPCDCAGLDSAETKQELEGYTDSSALQLSTHEGEGCHADYVAIEGEEPLEEEFDGEAEAAVDDAIDFPHDVSDAEGESQSSPVESNPVEECSQGFLNHNDACGAVNSSQNLPDTIPKVEEDEHLEDVIGSEGTETVPILTADDFPPLEALASSLPKLHEGAASSGKRPDLSKTWATMLSETRDQPMRPMQSTVSLESDKIISRVSPEVDEEFFAVGTSSKDRQESKDGVRESRILSSSGHVSEQASQRWVEEDDGVGWINSSNIDSFRAKGGGLFSIPANSKSKAAKETEAQVACVTTDFSMQNVLLQMNLKVMSVDGMLVRNVKKWVLRCSACYRIHGELDRLFCSKCGANHLHRIACSLDSSTGQLKLHLKKNYQYNLRGKIHPLPKPGQQGKYEGELLLREDQLLSGIWKQKVVKIKKDVRSAFGPDVVSDLGLQLNKGARIKVGLGRANPNADKGRSKRGSKKKH